MENDLMPRRANDLLKRCFLVNSGIFNDLFIIKSYFRILGDSMKVYIVFSKVTYKNNYLHDIPNVIEIFKKEQDANERSHDLGEGTYVKEYEVIE